MNRQLLALAQPNSFGTNLFGHSGQLARPAPNRWALWKVRSPFRASGESGKFLRNDVSIERAFGWEIWGAALYAAAGVSGILAACFSVIAP